MKNHVDTVEVSVQEFPKSLYVQSFELNVAVNTIPMIMLNVLPIEPPTEGGTFVTASAPNIKDITRLYNDLVNYAAKLDTTATIKLKLVRNPEDEAFTIAEQSQEVTLEKWILTDVGLSAVQSTSAPYLTATFSHPSVMLDKTGMIYEEISNPGVLSDEYTEADGMDLISFMDDMYQKYASGGKIMFYELANEMQGGMANEFIGKVKELRTKDLVTYSPGVYLQDKTDGLFLTHITPQFIDNIKQAAGPLVCPQAFCQTTWHRLITDICPYFLVSIIPTYDKNKLLVEPTSPWQESIYSVMTPLASSVDMPPLDPCPLIGTAINKRAWDVFKTVNRANYSDKEQRASTTTTGTFSFYFPEKVLKNNPKGQILNLGDARLIADLVLLDYSVNAANGAPKGQDLETAGNAVENIDKVDLDTAYAEAMFLINYRKNCRASVITTPIFKDSDHNPIYPGRVITVYDTTTNSELMFGYLVKMTVKGSRQGNCMTVFELTHVRPTEKDREIYVDEGTENPCYAPLGRDKRYDFV